MNKIINFLKVKKNKSLRMIILCLSILVLVCCICVLTEIGLKNTNKQAIKNEINGFSINEQTEDLCISDYISEGYTGKKVCIAILDSGAYPHPDYEDRVVKFIDFINNRNDMYDDFGHGTNVAGIIGGNGKASNGKYTGVAPNVELVIIKVLDKMGQVNIKNFSNGLQWIIDNKDDFNIMVVCISFGFTDKENIGYNEIENLVKTIKDNGVLIITSAGNLGPGEYNITFPALLKDVISVGSLKIDNGKKCISDFSSRDDISCPSKPEIYTIGENIITTSYNAYGGNWYTKVNGTSFSAAIIAGEAALLLEKNTNSRLVEIETDILNINFKY